ncbi:class IV adenylate cyclase [Collimonas sp.]|jgi:predicted adenylyl cyclase CyaB|uniref:class IV adenylate cyclase n=1 Tax=Collimonas sp. TaxID=1963772 RepID=UPI002CEE8993|nr:class IV adenylate cyclase [Collimonas sp.]HWW07233.1 class IV adenylate cyclase [Collimonas sp.]
MASNIEIKARIDITPALITKVAAIADQGPIEIAQDDAFFGCANGRLKLRAFGNGSCQLIFYRRSDRDGPKESFYLISNSSEPDLLREVLSAAHGRVGRVVKQRTLYLAGRTRIHLDRVEGLGDFLELEVVLGDGESAEAGVDEAHALMAKIGIEATQLIEGAYVDLLTPQRDAASTPTIESETG